MTNFDQIDLFEKSVKKLSKMNFGTEPRKLVRRTDPATSVGGALAVNTTKSEREVYEAILTFGAGGCISTEVERRIPHRPSHSITPRFCKLIEKGLIEECGRRMGDYGVEVRVVRAKK